MTQSFAGFQCWTPERIGLVINKEALSVDRAIFLATHVPMRRISYERSPQYITETSETSLLSELNQAAVDDRHVFAVVKGIPGTGKSHLIRWLKEQYALSHPDDAVLLIARVNSSLRATIQQIIDARIFDTDTLPDQLRRLQSAVDVLSNETLAERLVNGLQEATHIFTSEEVQYRLGPLHRRITANRVESFLLDRNVREALKRESGPIERIATFLSTGTGTNLGIERLPGFDSADFIFGVDLRRRIKLGGYEEVKGFCDDLYLKEEIRESLARYLNFMLHSYAIGSAAQLAVGDLPAMFNDLRRHLRQQGKSLVLFIEDITAFTGIDEGLVEVLITQHTGEANADFCRLTSVVGTTDSYYADRFPDNIKERVTHELTLNARTGRNESHLLQNTDIRAEFAARYLNAMRVPHTELSMWAEHGAQPNALPNACEKCPHCEVCQESFGYIELQQHASNAGTKPRIGLYPFNLTSLNNLYGLLKEGISRTPRSLLNNIIAYILASHGDKIPAGEFPPSAVDLASDVEVPNFSPPMHERIVQQQGESDAKRLRTLLLFWGERNVFAHTINGTAFVGGLSSHVFRAFKLEVISGIARETPIALPPDEITEEKQHKVSELKPTSETGKYTQYISDWNNGGKLYAFDRFAGWLADLFRYFVDWQSHGISASQVREYVTGGRFYIERQSGAVQPGRLQLQFKYSQELVYVLQALADLNDNAITLQPEQYGEHFTTLGAWLHSQESRVVEFVREPTLQNPPRDYLAQVLLKDCALLACLSGDLDTSAPLNSATLYEQVVASCVKSSKEGWKASIEHVRESRPAEWSTLMRKLDTQDAVHLCRMELLQLLNRPQGASTNVRYLDATLALSTFADFNAAGWQLSPLMIKPQAKDPIWSSAIRIHEALMTGFEAVVESSRKKLEQEYAKLLNLLEEESPQVVFDAIHDLLTELRQIKEYPEELNAPFAPNTVASPLTPGELAGVELNIRQFLSITEPQAQAASLSMHYDDWIFTLQKYLQYLGTFVKVVSEQKANLKEDIAARKAKSDAEAKAKLVHRRLDEIINTLNLYEGQAKS